MSAYPAPTARQVSWARDIDECGELTLPLRVRPQVNPDRHARIRQKHFHHAALILVDRARRSPSNARHGHYGRGSARQRFSAEAHTYREAFQACDFGCS